MTALHHKKGISCIHIHGWIVNKWCPGCRSRWDKSAVDGLTAREFEQQCDLGLVHAALVAVEGGEIPLSPLLADFDLALVFSERMPPPAPSAN